MARPIHQPARPGRQTQRLGFPESVIQRGPDGPYVFTIHGGGSNLVAKLTPVTVAQLQDNWALVAKGLSDGETVVVDGQYRLEDGSKVRVEDGRQPASSSGAPGRGTRRGTSAPTNSPPTNQPPWQTGA